MLARRLRHRVENLRVPYRRLDSRNRAVSRTLAAQQRVTGNIDCGKGGRTDTAQPDLARIVIVSARSGLNKLSLHVAHLKVIQQSRAERVRIGREKALNTNIRISCQGIGYRDAI